MTTKLDSLISVARETDAKKDWDSPRALQSILKERDRRVVRSRILRRSALGFSVAATVAVVFLRGMSAPVASATPSPAPTATEAQREVIADLANGDGGYSRD
jgi:hypothetical protein